MRILWLCNIILPEVMEQIGKKPTPIGGWLTGMLEGILSCGSKVEIEICMPCTWIDEVSVSATARYRYYLFPCTRKDIYNFNVKIEQCFENVLSQSRPDIIHIWGTE